MTARMSERVPPPANQHSAKTAKSAPSAPSTISSSSSRPSDWSGMCRDKAKRTALASPRSSFVTSASVTPNVRTFRVSRQIIFASLDFVSNSTSSTVRNDIGLESTPNQKQLVLGQAGASAESPAIRSASQRASCHPFRFPLIRVTYRRDGLEPSSAGANSGRRAALSLIIPSTTATGPICNLPDLQGALPRTGLCQLRPLFLLSSRSPSKIAPGSSCLVHPRFARPSEEVPELRRRSQRGDHTP